VVQSLGKQHQIGGFWSKPQPAIAVSEFALANAAIEVGPSGDVVAKARDEFRAFGSGRARGRMRRVVPTTCTGQIGGEDLGAPAGAGPDLDHRLTRAKPEEPQGLLRTPPSVLGPLGVRAPGAGD